ncbi:MAG: transglutaminase domain-containing protein [Bacteroidota bacterium]
MKTYFSIFIFLVCHHFAVAQNYAHVDSVVATYPASFQSIEAFAERIDKDFTKDADKVRAAFYWLAHHIQYNYKILGTSRTGYPKITIRNYTDEADFHYQYKKAYAAYALKYKVAVCEGYSQLLFYVCEHLGIPSKVIQGNALKSNHQYGVIPNNTNHKWNAVFFNDKWNLIDITWSTGNRPDKRKHVEFHNTYFCISPEKMILNHLPKDSKWQLLETPMQKTEFYTQPVVYAPYLALDNVLDTKIRRRIKAKNNAFVTLRFTQLDTTQNYYYAYSKEPRSTKLAITKVGNEYIAKVPFSNTTMDELIIYVGKMGMLNFQIVPAR